MNKLWLIVLVCLAASLDLQAQIVAVKTNLLYDAAATPNAAVEVALNKRMSIDLSGGYNGWTFSGDKSLKHWAIQPEFRYWLFESFNGHYLGVHAAYMNYDFAGIRLPFGMGKTHAYDGDAYGGGISYGYHLYLTPRWNIEFTAGVGYLYFKYDKYSFPDRAREGLFRNNYFGPTKLGISIVYIIK